MKDNKLKNKRRKANYDQTKIKIAKKRRPTMIPHRPWTHEDEYYVLHSLWSDRILGKAIGRSVQAIQQRRCLLNRRRL